MTEDEAKFYGSWYKHIAEKIAGVGSVLFFTNIILFMMFIHSCTRGT